MTKKLSVSVPDDLWERALAQRPDLNPSHLVQTALEAWTRVPDSAGFSLQRPADAEKGFQAARDHLAAIARGEFEEGYRRAVDTMPKLSWWSIQSLAQRNFDVKGWAEGYGKQDVEVQLGMLPKEFEPDQDTVQALIDGLGAWIMPYGDGSPTPRPTIPFLRGFAKAFRDLWEETVDGPTGASAATSTTDGEAALGS